MKLKLDLSPSERLVLQNSVNKSAEVAAGTRNSPLAARWGAGYRSNTPDLRFEHSGQVLLISFLFFLTNIDQIIVFIMRNRRKPRENSFFLTKVQSIIQ